MSEPIDVEFTIVSAGEEPQPEILTLPPWVAKHPKLLKAFIVLGVAAIHFIAVHSAIPR